MPNSTAAPTSHPRDGRYITAHGTLRVLFVFAQFSDDNYDINNSVWKKNQAPSYMQDMVDETWSSNATGGSLTDYYNQVSFNKLKVIGTEVFRIAPHSRQYYLDNNKKRGFIQEEILQDLDNTFDFSAYDNWKCTSAYQHSNTADGKVDMIVFIWRNIAKEYGADEENKKKLLGFKNNYGTLGFGSSGFYVDSNQRRIRGSYGVNAGSGVTIIWGLSEDYAKRYTVHEVGHWLEGHNPEHTGFAFWGMLSAWGTRNYCPNAFERHRLGWITVTEINTYTQTTNVSLGDYITTGDALRIEIDAATNKYFYVENHQNISSWDNSDKTGSSGIYVYHQYGSQGGDIEFLPADGRYNWSVTEMVDNPWGNNPEKLPVWLRGSVNTSSTSGYSDCDKIPYSYGGYSGTSQIEFYREETDGPIIQDPLFRGDGKDQFDLTNRKVFSPWSNINSQTHSGASTGIGFEVNSINNGVYNITVYVNTASNASPAKPSDYKAFMYNDHPKLTWYSNSEPDFNRYEIYRSDNQSSGYNNIANVTSISSNNFEDINYPAQSASGYLYYKMRVKDNSGKHSIYTKTVGLNIKPNIPQNFHIVSVPDNNGPYEHPKLMWNAKSEADLSGYKIERKINSSGSWHTIHTASPGETEYLDLDITRERGMNDSKAYYRMRAYDTADLYSAYTPTQSYSFSGNAGFKPPANYTRKDIPDEFALLQNYPNPFNPQTRIAVDLPQASHVVLKVYSISGEEIATLVNGQLEAGKYNFTFNAGHLPSGIYLYRLKAGNYEAVKRMLLVK